MSTETKLEASLWERLADSLNAFSENIVSFLSRLFGSSNERTIRSLGYVRPKGAVRHTVVPGSILDQVNALEGGAMSLTDEEIKALATWFRIRLGIWEADEHAEKLPESLRAVLRHSRGSTEAPGPNLEVLELVARFAEAPDEVPLDDLPDRLLQFYQAGRKDGAELPFDPNDATAYLGLGAPQPKDLLEAIRSLEIPENPTRSDYYQLPAWLKVLLLNPEEEREKFFSYLQSLPEPAELDDLLPAAFAVCREAARRHKNMRHFDVQIIGGVVLHRGNIAEMVTGEGKTLVATLPAYLNALEGQGVHIVTVNDYLARRDCEWMSPIYHALGITCGFIQSEMDPADRRRAYDCDITYGTNSEFGFDYLRDNMKPARWGDPNYPPEMQQVQKALHYAIIDEVDNILIDEARTPLIISGPAHDDPRKYARANDIVLRLNELQKREPGKYFEVKEKEHTVHLTDEGIRKAEELANVESFYTAGNMEWPHLIDNALKAHHLYHKDKQYVVMRHPEPPHDMSVIIVDEFTGRLMVGRQWSDGLHQAVEAKHAREGVKIKEETQTLATVTLQNFFRLYDKLAGMTGTAMTEANEFWKIYKLDVVAIPTNMPLIRRDYPDLIYRTEREKWNAVVDEIERIHKWDILHLEDGTEIVGTITRETDDCIEYQPAKSKKKESIEREKIDWIERRGRPILIGTTNVEKSERLSALLKRRGIKHELLNAKPEYAAREAQIIAQAGRIGAVTISTNMAGRGTDIILGGNVEFLAWDRLRHKYESRLDVPPEEWKQVVDEIEAKEKTREEGRRVAQMGGLHVIGTERHEARRIDNQLRGRAGRQGDPGSTRFYLSLEDDLMRIFAGDWAKKVLTMLGMEEGQAIESRMVSRRIEAAQKKVEERNFDIRKHLLEYDEVMDHQRKEVYGYRQRILEDANCKLLIYEMLERQVTGAVEEFLDDDYGYACFAEFASNRLQVEFHPSDFRRMNLEQAEQWAKDKAERIVETQVYDILEENLSTDADPNEWNWQACSNAIRSRWGIKLNERQLKKIGRDDLAEHLIREAVKVVQGIDLSEGEKYLDLDWGLHSICDWVRHKFQVTLEIDEIRDKRAEEIEAIILGKIRELYTQKDIEFPVKLAVARFMSARTIIATGGEKRLDREGLLAFCQERFPNFQELLGEEDFRSLKRSEIIDKLIEVSRRTFPRTAEGEVITQFDIDARLEAAFDGEDYLSEEAASELARWLQSDVGLNVDAESLLDLEFDEARHAVWTAYDEKYRPEMRKMERGLLLTHLDNSWKNHLYVMDHLRQGIGLRGYGQEDPKTVYKQEGMKEFELMWKGIRDKVSDTVFRMEEGEAFEQSVWDIRSYRHDEGAFQLPEDSIQQQQQAAIEASHQSGDGKKVQPIRNREKRTGRNSPCPCGSGKKYKNCCMRKMVG